MTQSIDTTNPREMCLLLRAHAEQRWLVNAIVPLVRQLEQPGGVPDDQLGAALAYLEVQWLDARQRAAETDAAYSDLDHGNRDSDRVLYEKARRYHTAVRRLRAVLERRVSRIVSAHEHDLEHELAGL